MKNREIIKLFNKLGQESKKEPYMLEKLSFKNG